VMKNRKAYESPRLAVVKLNPTQAVLSACAVGVTTTWKDNSAHECSGVHNCRWDQAGKGDFQNAS
jgi:hypothetical protein